MLLVVLFSILCGLIYGYPDGKPAGEMGTNPVVITPLGSVRGSTMASRLGKTIFAFRGMPYAKPPIGNLRFKPPHPIEKWGDVLNATDDGYACPQRANFPVSEDCLVLNVYSTALPKGESNPKRPVIIYFHAGGFYSLSGQSTWAGPQYFMDKEIVLVTPNYRLASLGFLSTGDKEAPGNNGLKDQVQVLRWVKQNIEAFGGDPDLVTIMGYSAGAVSVTLHMVSPMSRGLFHRAIAMSGSATGNWPLPKHQLNLAKKQAQFVGCPDNNPAEIIKCLKTKDAVEIGRTFPKFQEFGTDPVLIWSPVIEPDFGQERFLTEDPITLFRKGNHAQVPFITGITADEFASRAFALQNNDTLVDQINKNFEKYAPIAFLYERNSERSRKISKALKKFYFNDKPIDNTTLTPLAQLYADGIIGFGVHRIAQLIAVTNNNPVYYYRFAYKNRYSYFYLPGTNDTVPYGTVHHDDLIYLFYVSKLFPLFKESDPESKIVNCLTTMWTNFARTGTPIPESPDKWERFTIENKKYLNIADNLTLNTNLYETRYEEWDNLYPLMDHQHGK